MGRIRDYYWLCKPGIVYGNIIHLMAGVFLAAPYGLTYRAVIGSAVGTGLVIASACAANNYFDRAIDAKMKRTSWRATAVGSVGPRQVFVFSAVLLVSGLALLLWLTNWLVVGLGVAAYVLYVFVYTFSKPVTPHSTLIGSIPGALPAVAGYVAVSSEFDAGAWLIFFLVLCWQMPHFYAISVFRRDEYKAAKVPVLGVVAPLKEVKINMALFLLSYLVTILLMASLEVTGLPATVLLLAGTAYWLLVFMKRTADGKRWARRVFGASLVTSILLPVAAFINIVWR
jgi:protoheme IX farnesyltransferase